MRFNTVASLLLAAGFWLLADSCSNEGPNYKPIDPGTAADPVQPSIANLDFTVVNSYPHDVNSFTEGLLFHNGELYESTGATDDLSQTRSLFGTVDLATGKINVKAELDREKYFGEGIALLNNKVYQLTYRTKVGFVYDATTFKQLGQFSFPSAEGWGMTTNGKSLIMSDGTHILTWLDPKTFKTVKTLEVSENGFVKESLNELELINGYLYANVWPMNSIVKIDTTSGKVLASLDLTTLAKEARKLHPGTHEMNGIALHPTNGTVFVTGKMWPKIYEIRFAM